MTCTCTPKILCIVQNGPSVVLQSVAELEAARGELNIQASQAAGEVSRLSVALQDLEQQKAGLSRKLSV